MLDRKTPPQVDQGLFTNQAITNWRNSYGRRLDTFVGITDLQTNSFHLFPTFIVKTGGYKNSNSLTTTYLGKDVGAYAGTVGAAQANYGHDNAIVIEPGLGGGFDGLAHQRACQLAKCSEAHVIGWAIMGNDNKDGVNDYYLRFVSGRNLHKFNARANPTDGTKEARDLPRAWADWVANVIQNDLGVFTLIERNHANGASNKIGNFLVMH